MCRWYTSYNEFVGAVAIFLTAAVAVVVEHADSESSLGAGRIGLALFSVFQARFLYTTDHFIFRMKIDFKPIYGFNLRSIQDSLKVEM